MVKVVGSLHEFNGKWFVLTPRFKRDGAFYRKLCHLVTGEEFDPESLVASAEFRTSNIDATNNLGTIVSWDDGAVGLLRYSPQDSARVVYQIPHVGKLERVGIVKGRTGRMDEVKALLGSPRSQHTTHVYGEHRVIVNKNPTDKVAILIHGNNQTATSWIPGEVDDSDGKVAFCKELLLLGYDIVALKSPDSAFSSSDEEEMSFLIELCETFISRLPAEKNELLGMGFSAGSGPAQIIAAAFQPKMKRVGATIFNARGSFKAFSESTNLWCFWAVSTNDQIVDVSEIRTQIRSIQSLTSGVIDLHERRLDGYAHRVSAESLPSWRQWYKRWQAST